MTWLDIDKFKVAEQRLKWVQVRGTWVTMIRAKPKYISVISGDSQTKCTYVLVNRQKQSSKMYVTERSTHHCF